MSRRLSHRLSHRLGRRQAMPGPALAGRLGLLLAGFLMASLWAAPAAAHSPSDSYLTLELDSTPAKGRWDLALRDLDLALGLDADHDGAITWGELRQRHAAIADYALGRLEVRRGDTPCELAPIAQQVDHHGENAYSVLRFAIECGPSSGEVRVDYRLFFDLDPTHRGLLHVRGGGEVATAVLAPARPSFTWSPQAPRTWRTFVDYWREGVWHIWIGADHLLFLLVLLLPAVLVRREGGWQAADGLGGVLREVVAVVTAFTAAHSLTLSAAVLGWAVPPARWVESAIAATVVLAAAHNLRPVWRVRAWRLALVLGLVHGFGFAGALGELGLPAGALASALAGFNLGVEAGQLVIVAGFVPLAFLARASAIYRRAVVPGGSLAVALIALAWLAERSLDLDVWP